MLRILFIALGAAVSLILLLWMTRPEARPTTPAVLSMPSGDRQETVLTVEDENKVSTPAGLLLPPLETAQDCYQAHARGEIGREDFTESEWLAVEARVAEHLWMKGQSTSSLREATVDRWASLPDVDSLAARLSVQLDDTARQELRAIANEHRAQIEAAGRGIPELVQELMQEQWSSGGFHRLPNPVDPADIQALAPPGSGLFSTTGGGPVGDHVYHFVFDSQEHPGLESRLADLEAVRRASIERVVAYLDTLR